jgi:hypothetical protein
MYVTGAPILALKQIFDEENMLLLRNRDVTGAEKTVT